MRSLESRFKRRHFAKWFGLACASVSISSAEEKDKAVFNGYDTCSSDLEEYPANRLWISLEMLGLVPLQLMEAGPMRPKFSIRLVDSMHDMSKAKVERVSKVRWVRIKQIDSDSGMNQKLDTGDKGLLTFLSITGDSSRLDNVGKTRGIRLGPKEVEVLSRMIEFFKNTESRVKTDEPTRDGSSGNPWSALEIIYDGRIKVFLANRPNAVFEETAQTFSDFFDELMK